MYGVIVLDFRAPFIQTKCSFEIYVNAGFIIRCLHTAVSLTLIREQRIIRMYYCCYYYY